MRKICTIFFVCFFNFAYSQVIVCYGTSKNYSVDTDGGATPDGTPGSTYTWKVKNSDGTINTTPVISPSRAGISNDVLIDWGTTVAGNYTIEVEETNASCTAPPSTLTITIKNNPTVSTSNVAVCLNSNINLVATPSPAGTYTFDWTTVPTGYLGVTNFTGISTPTHDLPISAATTAMAGNYTVKVEDSDGCVSALSTAVLTVNPLPDASITPSGPTEFCEGFSVVLNAPAGLSYAWYRDGSPLASETAVNYLASIAGDYTVTTINPATSCSNTSSATSIVVNTNPTVMVSPSVTQFCEGGSATLTATPNTGTTPYTYQWYNGSGVISGETNQTYVATVTSDYKVKVTDGKGCFVESTQQTITSRPNPDASISATSATTFCAGESVVLQRGSVALAGLKYQWLKDGFNIPLATNFNYTAVDSGIYKVQVVDESFPTNCTVTSASGVSVSRTELPVTSTITAH